VGLLSRNRQASQQEPVLDLIKEEQPHVQVWGRPGRCPNCDGRGYLDGIDVIDRVMHQHCKECGHVWEVAEAQTVPAQ
jgi:hypothetical protein